MKFFKIRKRTGFLFFKKIRSCLNYCGLDLGNHNKSLRLRPLSSIYWRSIALDSPNFCHLYSTLTQRLYCKIWRKSLGGIIEIIALEVSPFNQHCSQSLPPLTTHSNGVQKFDQTCHYSDPFRPKISKKIQVVKPDVASTFPHCLLESVGQFKRYWHMKENTG